MDKEKPKIIFIIGPSGSGKTYMSLHLQEEPYFIPSIVSFTTREKRPTETNGIEHFFVVEEEYWKAKQSNNIFAETIFGGKYYWSTLSQIYENKICTYIVDEKGLINFIQNKKLNTLFDTISIYVDRTQKNILKDVEQKRIDRDKDRINLPESFYDYIIHNDDSLKNFNLQIDKIYKNLIRKNFIHQNGFIN